MKTVLIAVTLTIIFTSCATQRTIYYWGNYSSTLYSYKQDPSDETLIEHKNALLEIFEKGAKKKKKVPPGLYSEYGYILLNEGNAEEANKYFELEKTTYPESELFIKKFTNQEKNEEEQ
jgi:hypothetical protein